MESSLGSIQLNAEESEIYKTVLVSGQLSLAEIVDSTSVNEDGINVIIEGLINKKLLRRIPGMLDRFACLLPLGSTKDELEKASEEVAILGREIDAAADEQVVRLQSQLEEAKLDLQAQVDEKSAELNQAVTSLKTTVSSNKSSTDETIATEQSNAAQSIDDTVSKVSVAVTDTVTKFQTEASGRITSKSESLDRSASAAKAAQENIKSEAGEGLQELDTNALENAKTESIASMGRVFGSSSEMLGSVNTSVMGSIETMKTGFDTQVDAVSTSGEAFNSQSTGLFNQAKSSLIDQVSSQQGKISQIQSSLAETATSIRTTLDAGITSQNNLKDQTTEKLSTVENEINQSLDGIQSAMSSNLQSSSSSISQMVDNTSMKLAEHQSELENSVQSLLETQKEQIKSELQSRIQSFVDETNQQLDQMMGAFSSQLGEKTTQLMQMRTQIQDDAKSSLESQTDSIGSRIQESISTAKSSQSGVFQRAREEVTELSTQAKQQLNNSKAALTSAADAINSEFTQATTDLTQWNEGIQQQLDGFIQEQSRIFTEVLQNSIQTIKQQANEQSTHLNTQLTENFVSITAQLRESQNQSTQLVEGAINETMSALNSLHENMKQRFDGAVSQSRNKYNTLIDENKSGMSELITQLDRDTSAIKEDLTTSMTQHLGDMQNQLKQMVTSTFTQVSTMVENVKSTIDNQVAQSEAIGRQIMQSVADLSSRGTESQISAVKGTFATYGTKYKDTTNTVSEKVTALATILDTIFKLQEDTPTPTIKTSHVVGKSSIVNYVNDMISRVKSKMTILVPDISMIRDAKILEMPRTAQITIVSHIDEVTHKDWIDKMHGASANVTLRTLTQQGGFGAQLPDFIGGEREGEEIIIGTVDEGNKDYVAIASNSENFVKIFGSQIISEYARGRSRQLQK